MQNTEEKLSFSVLTDEEVKRLSVEEVKSLSIMDQDQNPVLSGLHGTSMGATIQRKICRTCNGDISTCMGHFGHIQLPIVCINPVFSKELCRLLNLFCSSCFQLQTSTINVRIFIVQSYLINQGRISECSKWNDFWNCSEDKFQDVHNEIRVIEKEIKHCLSNEVTSIKNNNSLHEELKKTFLSLIVKRKLCIHCREKMNAYRLTEYGIVRAHVGKFSTNYKNDFTLMADDIRAFLRLAWKKLKHFFRAFYQIFRNVNYKYSTDIFFMENILVPPLPLRPPNFLDSRVFVNHQTTLYNKLIFEKKNLEVIKEFMKVSSISELSKRNQNVINLSKGATAEEKFNYEKNSLQLSLNRIYDSNIKSYMNTKGSSSGIRQILEKKDGLFRLMMMGKRANFSARTVITPDASIDVDEVGVPLAFAKELTYPVKVSYLNANEIRKMVLNGPDKYPGARFIDQGDGHIKVIPGGNSFEMKAKRQMYAAMLLTPIHWDLINVKKTVYRHLIDGDMVIMNRQPTLHRSSMLAHRVKVLRNEKTFRLHYAVCKGYNADFDGDELNLHCVQDDCSKAELKYLNSVNCHYTTPKSGTPLNGLIQDHIIAAVNLTLRDKFFTFNEYLCLVCHGLNNNKELKLLPPAIMKPGKYWTGKQVFSTIILNILPESKNPLTLSSTSSIKLPSRNVHLSDSSVYFLNGQLMTGVIDKNHIGGTCYSLIHCVNELYNGEISTQLLSCFSRMLTLYLNMSGYSLGIQCMLLKKDTMEKREDKVKEGAEFGKTICAQVLKIPQDKLLTYQNKDIYYLLEKSYKTDANFKDILDNVYQEKLDEFTKNIEKLTDNNGLLYNGIKNELQLMVMSGAKGNRENVMKITTVFGQMILEGKRPGLSLSGRSLPNFQPYDYHPMAGGYIFSNVAIGLFHTDVYYSCSAGREGLMDTALKTSRSGYLQRCLIKHLEGVIVHCDGTVRDSDGSIIQFLYGEDGLDVTKTTFLNYNQLDFLIANRKVILDEENNKIQEFTWDKKVTKYRKKYSKYLNKKPKQKDRRSPFLEYCNQCPNRDKKWLMKKWYNCSDDVKKACQELLPKHMDPINSIYLPQRYLESCSDKALNLINAKVAELKEIGQNHETFEKLMFYKLNSSLVDHGEPVGCLAAQSLGEPSTQMTLNTFHFAGNVDKNVTLGIPRLLEILKTAPKSIKTPYVDVPFRSIDDVEMKSKKILSELQRIHLVDVLKHIDVLTIENPANISLPEIHLILFFRDNDSYKNKLMPKPKTIMKNISSKLFKPLFKMINQYIRIVKNNNNQSIQEVDSELTEDVYDDDDYDDEQQEVGFKNFQRRACDKTDKDEFLDSEYDEDNCEDREDKEVEEDNNSDYVDYYDDEAVSDSEFEQEHEDENENQYDNDSESSVEQERVTLKTKKLIDSVLEISKLIKHFNFDKQNYSWCVLQFVVPIALIHLDFKYLLLMIARSSLIQEIKGIKNVTTYRKENELILRSEGTNFDEIFNYIQLLDIDRIYCNDIYKMQTIYGIEAARNAIIKEVKNVFAAYNIFIDFRHLSLVADYLTYNGSYSGFNRFSMSTCASTMQKTTFETSMQFLKQTVLEGKSDPLISSSGCIMTGKRPLVGTAMLDLLEDKEMIKSKKEVDREYASKFRKQFEQMNRDFIEKYNATHEDKIDYTSCIKQEDYDIKEKDDNDNNIETIIPFF